MGVSLRQAAKQYGVTHQTLLKAARSGQLHLEPDGSIDPQKLEQSEWWHNHRGRTSRTEGHSAASNNAELLAPDKTAVQKKIERICKALRIKGDPGVMLGIDKIQLEKLLLIERRQALQRENETAEGMLLDAQQVESQWLRIAAVLKSRLLQIPGALSGKLVSITDPQQIRNILEQEIREALTELSETWSDAE